jgi:hypothetical protein
MTLYVENSKDNQTHDQSKLKNEFSKFSITNFNIQMLVVIQYTMGEQSEKLVRKTISSIIASKRIKCLGMT